MYCDKCNSWYLDGSIHSCPVYPFSVKPQYEAMNDLIGVEPFKTDAVEKTGVSKGFATAKQKTELAALTVLFGTEKIPVGSVVYVRGDLCVEPDSKKVYELDGHKVIFISVKEVKVVRHWDVGAPKAAWNQTVTQTVTKGE